MEREEKKPCYLGRKTQPRAASRAGLAKNTKVSRGIDTHSKLAYRSDSLAGAERNARVVGTLGGS